MADNGQARTIVGVIGNIISLGLFLSPIPTFIKIIKQKAVEDFKPDPYVATILNCLMWTFYGMPFVHPNSTLVITINGAGLIIELIYVAIFFIYSTGAKRKRILVVLLAELVFFIIVIFITMHFFHTTKTRTTFVGIICIIFNIIMYISPLSVMGMVIKTKSVKFMPFTLSLANFCNGVIWVAYALLQFDLNMLIPNALGSLSGLVQLVLFCVFYKTTNWDEDEQAGEVQLHSTSHV